MKKTATLLISLIIILTACSKEENIQEEKTPELLEVSIKTAEKIIAHQETTIEAIVTQGDEKVTAADEVKLEISKIGEKKHETLQAEHSNNGIYTIQKIFPEGGKYVVIAHVTANSMHIMPKKELIVEPGADEIQSKENQPPQTEQHAAGSHDHHPSDAEFNFETDGSLTSQKPQLLKTSIKQSDQPVVVGAIVRFEIWHETSNQHEFHNSFEGPNGEYSLSYTFQNKGKYTVKIHFEKGELHDHTEEIVEVE